ncbi:MAG: hypothetical protein LBT27_06995, partial [Prevotellaceae bacterium]|nr:hypothetical protein [Prevotellaceae bacterium]
AAADKERGVYIPAIDNCTTTQIGFDFDDNNDLELYEVKNISEQELLSKIVDDERYYIENELFSALKTIELLKYQISELEKDLQNQNTAK